MDDVTFIGTLGTFATIGLGQISDILSICAGLLTCTYLIWKLVRLAKSK